jgi:L-lactate dehydrogenase (cytochrome)
MRVLCSIADLRAQARRRVPRALFEYADRGAGDELTLRRNRADLDALELRQRVLIDVSRQSLTTTVMGERWSMPVGIGPTGLAGFFYKDGEICGARAAGAIGVPFTLSTMSICSIEDVAAAGVKPFWFQLYMVKDRGFNAALIERARAAGCSTLMLTVDLCVAGIRRRDAHNGLSVPPRVTLANMLDVLGKPRWIHGLLTGKRRGFGNFVNRLPGTGDLKTLQEWIASQFDPSITWKELEWLRARWPGKLVIKGILDAEDARLAADCGVDALVVSNHGGRQLDSAASTIAVLPEVVAAVAGRTEVLFDGGVQSGMDVLKALACGARACLIGKAFLYGLAADGEAGVLQAFGILRRELEVSMALTGCADLTQVSAGILRARQR